MSRQFISKVENFIDENSMLSKKDHVIIGVSGGPDSVALFLVLNYLKSKYELKLSVVHVHHGLREEADEEALYVSNLCKRYDVDFHLFKYDVHKESKKLHLGTEETGRKLRYDAFENIAGSDGKIAIAHNMNDRSETMLFHLCRGTGPRGMAAIKAVNGNRIRPLLCVQRSEIEEFLDEEGVKYYIDSSNSENEYTRNKLRNQVFPLLKSEINEESIKHMAYASKLLEDQNDYITMVALKELENALIKKEAGSISIRRAYFNNLHISVKRELVKQLIDIMVPRNKDITLSHIDSIIQMALKEGNYQVNLPYNLVSSVEYDCLSLSMDQAQEGNQFTSLELKPGCFQVSGLGSLKIELFERSKDFVLLQKEYTKYFDYDKIKCCLELRNRQEGDFLTINEKLGKKKLKDFFIDNKVPKNERDKTFLVADESHVLWVIGSRISEYYKVTEKTKNIISIGIIKEDI